MSRTFLAFSTFTFASEKAFYTVPHFYRGFESHLFRFLANEQFTKANHGLLQQKLQQIIVVHFVRDVETDAVVLGQ